MLCSAPRSAVSHGSHKDEWPCRTPVHNQLKTCKIFIILYIPDP